MVLFTACTLIHSMRSFPNLFCLFTKLRTRRDGGRRKTESFSYISFYFIIFFSYFVISLRLFFLLNSKFTFLEIEKKALNGDLDGDEVS